MMEQQLKERLVGATVLVVLAIIVIPVVLDGPGGRDKVEERLDLPAAGNGERRTLRIPLDQPAGTTESSPESAEPGSAEPGSAEPSPAPTRTADVQAGSDTAASSRETRGEPAATKAGQSSANRESGNRQAVETREAAADDSTPQESGTVAEAALPWTVQVGSFSNENNAQGLVERLQLLGYSAAHVSRYDDGSRVHYRVRVGGFADRDAAAAKAAEISERSGEPARPARN